MNISLKEVRAMENYILESVNNYYIPNRMFQYSELIIKALKDNPKQLDIWEAKLKETIDDNAIIIDFYFDTEPIIAVLERLYLTRSKMDEYNKLENFRQQWEKEYNNPW